MAKIFLGIGVGVLTQVVRYWINDYISALIGFLVALVFIAWGIIDQIRASGRETEEALSIAGGAFRPEPEPLPRKPLLLSFDPNDPSCKQSEGVPSIPHHLFRVRVNNGNSTPNHRVKVVVESASSLPKHQGVELQVRHHRGISTIDVSGDGKEYFDLLEYNSYDIATNRPVLHLCHVTSSVDKSIPVGDYRVTLRAYSEEGASNSLVLTFRCLSRDSCELVQADGVIV